MFSLKQPLLKPHPPLGKTELQTTGRLGGPRLERLSWDPHIPTHKKVSVYFHQGRSVEKEWCVSEEASLERGDGHMTQHRKMAGDH